MELKKDNSLETKENSENPNKLNDSQALDDKQSKYTPEEIKERRMFIIKVIGIFWLIAVPVIIASIIQTIVI